jgi:hypothetical protein
MEPGGTHFSARLETVSKQVGAGSVDSGELEELKNKIDSLVSSLPAAATQGVRVPADVVCPECARPVKVMLGVVGGDSAMPTCSLGHKFHVHRDRQGGVFTKNYGSSQMVAVRHVRVLCSECETNYIDFDVPEAEDEPQTKWCLRLNCYARLVVDPVSGGILEVRKEEPLAGRIVGDVGGKSVVQCSSCNGESKAFAKKDGHVFAQCFKEHRLLRAPADDETTPGSAPATAWTT